MKIERGICSMKEALCGIELKNVCKHSNYVKLLFFTFSIQNKLLIVCFKTVRPRLILVIDLSHFGASSQVVILLIDQCIFFVVT